MRGRKPKPLALRMLYNPGRQKVNMNEPEYTKMSYADTPDAPDYLNEYGKQEWYRLYPIVAGSGVLTEADITNLALCCQCYGCAVEAAHNIKNGKELMGGKKNAYNVMHDNISLWKTLASELGLTPASRTRIKVEPTQKKTDDTYFD